MENNQYQQPQYQQAQPVYQYQPVQAQQPVDPNYSEVSKEFLTKAIVSCAIASLPVGSIIAIFMATKNRTARLDYLAKGGTHTDKIKISSALSRAGKYAGIAYTCIWAFYMLYWLVMIFIIIGAAVAQTR